MSETFDMTQDTGAADIRCESDLVAEARSLQARHARRAIGAAMRRLRGVLARLAGEPAHVGWRRLTVH